MLPGCSTRCSKSRATRGAPATRRTSRTRGRSRSTRRRRRSGDGVSDGFFERLDFLTDPSLATDPYPYYDWLHQYPVLREPTRGVVMVSGYDEAVSVWRDDKETFSA